jgi:cytochrome c oxidase subunit 2
MKKFKKPFVLISILVLAFTLSACGGGKDQAAEPAPAETAPADQNSGTNAPQGTGENTANEGTVDVVIQAKNWAFEPAEIRVKAGQTVNLTLENVEGVHGIAIPDLDIELNAGETTSFVADQAGEYQYQCSIVCGTGHANMLGKIIVEE